MTAARPEQAVAPGRDKFNAWLNAKTAPELEDLLAAAERARDEAADEVRQLHAAWPRCPDGCGCRLATVDADTRDCACDGPCCLECRENGYPDAPSYRDLAVKHAMDERDSLTERVAELVTEGNGLREELAGVRKFADALERITTAWTRGMYSAWIDCQRGDVKAAAMCLSEGLDGYDGTRWNGTETGEQWWERTKAEEGLTDDPPAVATSGTEWLAKEIHDLATPDEETRP